MTDYDLVVIGAGPAGEKGAAQAAYFGKRVCIVERAPRPGGAAVNTGAIPSKTLRETALSFADLRRRGLYGVDMHVKPNISVADFMYRERAAIESQWKLIDENIKKHGIEQLQGTARFVDAHSIDVSRYGTEPRRVTSEFFLVATGSHPQPPAGFAIDNELVFDAESIHTLERIPASMVVIGGGAIGCEYASIFAALGVRVTIVTSRARLLAHLDADVSDALRQQLTARFGVTVLLDCDVSNVYTRDGRAFVQLGPETEIAADSVLHCAGRCGSSRDLGLDALGIETDARGFIRTDAEFRTTRRSIFAAGDVIGFPALASTAMEQARVAVCRMFDLRFKQAIAHVIPCPVYAIPEIAGVGRTEEQLRADDIPFEIGRAHFRANPRGMILGDVDGFIKLLFRADDQRLLGASIVGESAGELIHIAAACLANEGTLDFFIQSVFNYPSLSDAYKYAAYDGLQALARRHARAPGLARAIPVTP